MADNFDDSLFEEREYDESLFEDEVVEPEDVAEQPEISALESAFGGAKAGAALGFRDELAGAAGALGHGVGSLVEGEMPDREALKETYREARGEERKRSKAESDANPYAYGGAELVTGLLTPAGGVKALTKLDKLQKLQKGLKGEKALKALGKAKSRELKKGIAGLAGVGAATGVGLSETDLTEGDPEQIKQVLQDAALGAGVGVAAPFGIKKIGRGVKKLVDTSAMRKSAEKNILGAFRPPKKILGKELLSGEKDQYKGVGRALLGKVRDPETGKDVSISAFKSDPEEMGGKIGLALDQNRAKIQKPFSIAQERIDQAIPMLRLKAVQRGETPDMELINQIGESVSKQIFRLKKGYGGKESANRVIDKTVDFVNENKDVLRSYNLNDLGTLKTSLGKQLSSSEWAKAIEDGSLKVEDKEVIKNMYFLVKGRIEDLANSVSKKGEKLGDEIKTLNSEYSNLLDAKLVNEFDMVRAARGPSLGYKDFILPGLIGVHSGPGALLAGAGMYAIEKSTGRKIGDMAQIASAKGLDNLANKVDKVASMASGLSDKAGDLASKAGSIVPEGTKARAKNVAKQLRDLVSRPANERHGILIQILANNEDLTGIEVKQPAQKDSNFNKLIDKPSNISQSSDEQLVDMQQRLQEKYGDEHVHVKLLNTIIQSDNKDFKRRKKIMLSTDRSFREMVDSAYEGEE